VRPQPLHPSTCPTARPPFRDRCLSSAPPGPGPPRLPPSPVTRRKMQPASVLPPSPHRSVPPARIGLSPRPASVRPTGPHRSVSPARIGPSPQPASVRLPGPHRSVPPARIGPSPQPAPRLDRRRGPAAATGPGRRTTRTPPRSPPWAGGGNGPADDSDLWRYPESIAARGRGPVRAGRLSTRTPTPWAGGAVAGWRGLGRLELHSSPSLYFMH
jgi:hypothetical protein